MTTTRKRRPAGLAARATSERQRAIIYTRISRDDTMLGKANDRQEEQCRRKADYKDYEIIDVVRDVSVSAFSGKDREGWLRVVERARNGECDVILAYHMDRVTRSMRDLEDLVDLALEHGVGIDFASGDIELTSDVGRMVARILAAVARAEVERKSERQRLAYEQRAKEGLPHAVRAFGYAPGCMVEEPAEAEAIRQAADDVLTGTSLQAIADRWVKQFPPCVKKCQEDHWHTRTPSSSQAVKYLLTNPRYIGVRFYYDEDMGEGQWEPILAQETWLALGSYFANPQRNHLGQVRTGRKPSTLLGGLATCDTCEQPSRATKAHGVLIYGCKGGMHVNTPREEADRLVEAKMVARLSRKDVLAKGLVGANSAAAKDAMGQISELVKRRTELAEDFSEGIIDRAAMRAGTLKINQQIADLDAVVKTAQPAQEYGVGTPAFVKKWEGLSLEEKRQLIGMYADITLVPKGKGNRRVEVPIEKQVLVDFG